jgi:hypothetical protein
MAKSQQATDKTRVRTPDLELPSDSDTSASGPLVAEDLSARPSKGFFAREMNIKTLFGSIAAHFFSMIA